MGGIYLDRSGSLSQTQSIDDGAILPEGIPHVGDGYLSNQGDGAYRFIDNAFCFSSIAMTSDLDEILSEEE